MCVDVVEKALVEIFLGHGSLPGAAVQRRDDLIAVRTQVPLQFFNGIPRSVLTAENADERVREMVAWYRETGTPFRWWITPSVQPANLVEILKANGFRHTYNSIGMAIDLASLPDQQTIPGLTIRRMDDPADFHLFTGTFTIGFERPQEEWASWDAVFRDFGFDGPWRHFLAFLDGAPVATSSLFIAGDLGGIYNVVTLPAARGKGIGAAVTLAALIAAKEEGCTTVSLQSSEMAYNVYRSLGFAHCCDLTLYDWRPEYT